MTTFGNVSTFGKGATPSPKAKANNTAANDSIANDSIANDSIANDSADDPAKEPLLNGKAKNKEPKRSGDYSSSSSSSSEDEAEVADTSDIQKALDEKFQEHRNSNDYSLIVDDEDYDQSKNPFSDSWADTK